MTTESPCVQGKLLLNETLAPLTWLRVGGAAQALFYPENLEDLQAFIAHKSADLSVTLLGAGSNVLVRDGGIPGAVIGFTKAGKDFNFVRVTGTMIEAGAGVLDKKIAKIACTAGVGGLAFLDTIPGSLGGAVRMNAGAFGNCIADVLIDVKAMDPYGKIHVLKNDELGFSYRHTAGLPADWIVLSGRLRGVLSHANRIRLEMTQLAIQRRHAQPTGRTGGSTFKNPTSDNATAKGRKAWQLIRQAGCADWTQSGACFSPKHANFLMNTGNASATDLEDLAEKVRQHVKKETGVALAWEIQRLGVRT